MFKPLFKGHSPNWHRKHFKNKWHDLFMKQDPNYISILDRVLQRKNGGRDR